MRVSYQFSSDVASIIGEFEISATNSIARMHADVMDDLSPRTSRRVSAGIFVSHAAGAGGRMVGAIAAVHGIQYRVFVAGHEGF